MDAHAVPALVLAHGEDPLVHAAEGYLPFFLPIVAISLVLVALWRRSN